MYHLAWRAPYGSIKRSWEKNHNLEQLKVTINVIIFKVLKYWLVTGHSLVPKKICLKNKHDCDQVWKKQYVQTIWFRVATLFPDSYHVSCIGKIQPNVNMTTTWDVKL